MPEKRSGQPRQSLRIAPYLNGPEPPGVDADTRRGGPSWSAPTVNLPVISDAGDGAQESLTGSLAVGTPRHRNDDRSSRRPRRLGRLASTVAFVVIVLFGSHSLLFSHAEPMWRSTPSASAPAGQATDAVLTDPNGPRATPDGPPKRTATSPSDAGGQSNPGRQSVHPQQRESSATGSRTRTSSPRAAAASPTIAAILLGPANEWDLWQLLNRYCAEADGGGTARLRSGNSPAVDNWECWRLFTTKPIDMTAACRHAYGTSAIARYTDPSNALSWRCYR